MGLESAPWCRTCNNSYKLPNFLVHILKPLTSTEYTERELFAFTEEIIEKDNEFFMVSLDVDSLFTNMSREEIINIHTNTLFENTEREEDLLKVWLNELMERSATWLM